MANIRVAQRLEKISIELGQIEKYVKMYGGVSSKDFFKTAYRLQDIIESAKSIGDVLELSDLG